MMKPSVGRVVWFHPGIGESLINYPGQPLAAIVAYVHNDRMVNLTVLDGNGHTHGRTSVKLLQDGGPVPDGGYAEWMPFQKGQQAKTEAAEAKLAAAG